LNLRYIERDARRYTPVDVLLCYTEAEAMFAGERETLFAKVDSLATKLMTFTENV